MKRTLTAFSFFCLIGCCLMAQKPISGFLNISGSIRSHYFWRDQLELKKGTPCSLLFVTKLKKPLQGEDTYQVVLKDGSNQQFYISLSLIGDYFKANVADKNGFWTMELLNKYPDAFMKKDELASIRKERRMDSDQYRSELKNSNLFYDDAAVEDYLQCLILDIMPDKQILNREITIPEVKLLKCAAPDMMMLGNDVLLVSTGMLATLDTEAELKALMLREVSHYLLDHAPLTIKQNIARANRAAFWRSVINEVVAAAEQTLYERYDYYQPGLLFATNDVIQSLVNRNIARRMGMDYAPKLESEADECSLSYMEVMGESQDALASALHKLNDYYLRENDVSALSKYGNYGTLEERLKELKKPDGLFVDRDYLIKMRSIVSFEAAMQDYNQQYRNARLLAMKNINHNLACVDDYLMVARSLMKSQNTPDSNAECLLYLDKADLLSDVGDVNVTKMRILLMLREDMMINAVDMIKKYQSQLDEIYRQPHTEEDAEWIVAEHSWAEKLLERIFLN